GKSRGFADATSSGSPLQAPIRSIEPYQPFPVEVLPAVVARYIQACAKALGCDPAYVGLPLLTMLTAAIGNSRRVRIKNSWSEPLVLWCATVANSGTQKSPSFELAL